MVLSMRSSFIAPPRARKMDGFGGIRDVSAEITAELNSLDANFPHASRLLKEGAPLHIEALATCISVCVCIRECVYFSFVSVNVAELDKHQKEQSEKMMDRSGIVKLTEKIYFSGKYEGAPKVCHEEGKCCPLMSGCDMKRAAGMPS